MNAFDLKSEVFGRVSSALKASFKGIAVSGEYDPNPSKFPSVTVVETDNSVYQRASEVVIENAISVAYEINVYSAKVGFKESEARKIMTIADEIMTELGFYRVSCNPVPNFLDSTIYRFVARYEGIAVQEDGENLSYRIYRK